MAFRSGCLRHLVRLQAARADVDASRAAPLLLDADLLEVGVEAPPGGDHGVTPRVAERGSLAAAVTDLGHRTRDGSGRLWAQLSAERSSDIRMATIAAPRP